MACSSIPKLGSEQRVRRRAFVGLEQRVMARLRRLGLPCQAVVAVGFSGGADSLALAALLGRLAEGGGIRPLLLHVDHRLREGSGEEQERAAALAGALALPFRGLRAADDPRRLHAGLGMEEAARRERYRLLAGAVAEVGAALLALAHHETDQAETVLLHLLRGAGLAGAAGMGERSELPVPWWEARTPSSPLQLWRPLLTEAREEVRAYAAGTRLIAIEDPSNAEERPRRNALRAEALPLLERIVPGATARLARYASLAAADDDLLEEIAGRVAARAMTSDGSLVPAAMAEEPLAVRRRVARRWLRDVRGVTPSAERVDAVLGLLASGRGGRWVEVGDGFGVVLSRGRLRVKAGSETGGEGGT